MVALYDGWAVIAVVDDEKSARSAVVRVLRAMAGG
jgi:hypothetical protein